MYHGKGYIRGATMDVGTLDSIFSSLTFDDDIDPKLMEQIILKMKNELKLKLIDTQEKYPEAVIQSPMNVMVPPLHEIQDLTEGIAHVYLLCFDGEASDENCINVRFSYEETASSFLERFLLSRNLPIDGDVRMDNGEPGSLSPATLIQPLWVTMKEALKLHAESPAQPKIVVHYYPKPPEEFLQTWKRWVRIVTLTRRCIFVPFIESTTTLGNLKFAIQLAAGIPAEWQRLFGGPNIRFEGDNSTLLSTIGVRHGVNIYLTHRIDGIEYLTNQRD